MPSTEPHAISVSSDDVVIHPGWARPVLVHDIALVRLSEPLTLNGKRNDLLLSVKIVILQPPYVKTSL